MGILDYLSKLRSQKQKPFERPFKGRTWAVGGGKDRAGKTFVAYGLAFGMALSGKNVLLIEAGKSERHVRNLFGVEKSDLTLSDFLKKDGIVSIKDIYIRTASNNLNIIYGGSEIFGLSDPKHPDNKKLITGLSGIEAEHVIIDVGSDTAPASLDLFNMADAGIIVSGPTDDSLRLAYGFLRDALHRKITALFVDNPRIANIVSSMLEPGEKSKDVSELIYVIKRTDRAALKKIIECTEKGGYGLVMNMCSRLAGETMHKTFNSIFYKRLNVRPRLLGAIEASEEIWKNGRQSCFVNPTDNSEIKLSVIELACRSLDISPPARTMSLAWHKKEPKPEAKERIALKAKTSDREMGINEEVEYAGGVLHFQTEDLGIEKRQIQTLVYEGGRILFSKTTGYDELKVDGNDPKAVHEKVMWHHKAIMKGVFSGKLKQVIKTKDTSE